MVFFRCVKKWQFLRDTHAPWLEKNLSVKANARVNDEKRCHYDNVNCQEIRAFVVSEVCFIYTNISILFSFLFYDKNDIKKE